MRNEVNPVLVRSVNAKQADQMVEAERQEQLARPRRPSQEVAIMKNAINEVMTRQGGSRRASIEMDHEQASRVQQYTFEREVGPALVRTVNAASADAAAELEQGGWQLHFPANR